MVMFRRSLSNNPEEEEEEQQGEERREEGWQGVGLHFFVFSLTQAQRDDQMLGQRYPPLPFAARNSVTGHSCVYVYDRMEDREQGREEEKSVLAVVVVSTSFPLFL